MNAYERIQQGKKEYEQFILKEIKKRGVYRNWDCGVPTLQSFNALDRLEQKGKVKYSKKLCGWVLK